MPATVTTDIRTFQPVRIGAGGFVTGLDVHADGTLVCRTDTYGCYLWNEATSDWTQLVTTNSMPSGDHGVYFDDGVYEICIAPSNSNIFYMVYMGYVYRSTNKGTTWTKTTGLSQIANCDANNANYKNKSRKFAIDPLDPDVIYFATRDLGLYRSLDGGSSWTLRTDVPVPFGAPSNSLPGMTGIIFDPTSGSVSGRTADLWCSSYGFGYYHSTDGGDTWALEADGPTTDVETASFSADGNLYCAVRLQQTHTAISKTNPAVVTYSGPDVYRDGMSILVLSGYTQTNGNSYTIANLDTGANTFELSGLDATAFGTYTSSFLRHWKFYKWNGSAWSILTAVTEDVQGPKSCACDPFDVDRVVFASSGGSTQETLDGGATCNPRNRPVTRVSTDITWFDMANETFMTNGNQLFHPTVQNKLLFAEGIGFWDCTLAPNYTAVEWHERSKNIEGLATNQILAPPNGPVFFASLDRAIFKSSNLDAYPSTYYLGDDAAITHCSHMDYCADDPTFIVAATSQQASYSDDSGATWTEYDTLPAFGISGNDGMGNLAVSTGDKNNLVWCPTSSRQPHYTLDRGATWTGCTFPGVAADTTVAGWGGFHSSLFLRRIVLCADKVTANKFYLMHYTVGMFVTTDGGANWTNVGTGFKPTPNILAFNAKLKAVPGNAGHLWLTAGEAGGTFGETPAGIFQRSTDGGANWSTIANVVEVEDFAFGKAATGATYPTLWIIGSVNLDHGVYYSTDEGISWTKVSDFPLDSLDDFHIIEGDKLTFGRAYIGFTGSGFAYLEGEAETEPPEPTPQPPIGGGGAAHPRKIKHEKERRETQKKNELAIEQTIRLAHQRLSGKVTEPEILKQAATPERLAVHAEKLAAQLVEKSKDSAKQRTRNKAIIAELKRQADLIMQEEEEAIVMLLH